MPVRPLPLGQHRPLGTKYINKKPSCMVGANCTDSNWNSNHPLYCRFQPPSPTPPSILTHPGGWSVCTEYYYGTLRGYPLAPPGLSDLYPWWPIRVYAPGIQILYIVMQSQPGRIDSIKGSRNQKEGGSREGGWPVGRDRVLGHW